MTTPIVGSVMFENAKFTRIRGDCRNVSVAHPKLNGGRPTRVPKTVIDPIDLRKAYARQQSMPTREAFKRDNYTYRHSKKPIK